MPLPVPKQVVPEKPLPPGAVPKPKKFGGSDDVTLPKTGVAAHRIPEGAEEGKETGKTPKAARPGRTDSTRAARSPSFPRTISTSLRARACRHRKPGDDSVTLDTDEFKFISYNRWLKIKVESDLKYPELAAISGYQGTLFIKFDIMKDGSLGRLRGAEVVGIQDPG